MTIEIDFVYTWVNGEDREWIESKNQWKKKQNVKSQESFNSNRFQNMDELKYSLKSIAKFVKFPFRKIFIVTNGQVPNFLNQFPNLEDKIVMIFHQQIFENPDRDLPTFNSIAIEANLHRIPGLAEHFIYLNDDVFFGRDIHLKDFWENGKTMIYPRGLDHPVRERPKNYKLKDYTFKDAIFNTHLYLNKYVKKREKRRTLYHVGYMLQKSVMDKIEVLLKDTGYWENTLTRFRRNKNILIISLFYCYYAYDNQYAVKNKKLNLLSITADHHLHYQKILNKNFHQYCMNNLKPSTKGLQSFFRKMNS